MPRTSSGHFNRRLNRLRRFAMECQTHEHINGETKWSIRSLQKLAEKKGFAIDVVFHEGRVYLIRRSHYDLTIEKQKRGY